jgi:hypothetical protein
MIGLATREPGRPPPSAERVPSAHDSPTPPAASCLLRRRHLAWGGGVRVRGGEEDFEGRRVVKKVRAGGKESRTVYVDRYSEERDGRLVKYVFSGDVRLSRRGFHENAVWVVGKIHTLQGDSWLE